jgi:hypothetical protein
VKEHKKGELEEEKEGEREMKTETDRHSHRTEACQKETFDKKQDKERKKGRTYKKVIQIICFT